MKSLSRRNLLALGSTVAVGAAALSMAGCATSTNSAGQTVVTINPSVLDFIQSAVSAATSIIPSAESIASVITALDPGLAAVVSTAEAVVNEAITVITGAINAVPPAAAKLRSAKLHAAYGDVPVATATVGGKAIAITGHRVAP